MLAEKQCILNRTNNSNIQFYILLSDLHKKSLPSKFSANHKQLTFSYFNATPMSYKVIAIVRTFLII